MKVIRKMIRTVLISSLACTMLMGITVSAAPGGYTATPRATGQQVGSYSTLQVTCTTENVAIKYTNNSGSKRFCEAVGYLKDKDGHDIDASIFDSGNINSGTSISDSQQRTDVFTVSASGNIYDGPSAGYGHLERVDLSVGR